MKTHQLLIALLTLLTTQAVACEISSGQQTIALVELYTSEGCSSCPPADQWLSGFVKKPASNVVALAFHVDYWDSLGWRDRFASPRFSQRQRERVAVGGGRTVYTPQLFINGSDQAYWRESSGVASAIDQINSRPAEAQLTLKLGPGKPWTSNLTGTIKHPTGQQQIWLAVYQDKLNSEVSTGENSGRRLQHDRVVRQWLGPFQANANGQIKVDQSVGNMEAFDPTQSGVAAVVEDKSSGKVLQAVSLPFCGQS
jgi:hypothetical protein